MAEDAVQKTTRKLGPLGPIAKWAFYGVGVMGILAMVGPADVTQIAKDAVVGAQELTQSASAVMAKISGAEVVVDAPTPEGLG